MTKRPLFPALMVCMAAATAAGCSHDAPPSPAPPTVPSGVPVAHHQPPPAVMQKREAMIERLRAQGRQRAQPQQKSPDGEDKTP